MTWLTGWNYQKQLNISSTNSTTQSSYQMKIIVYYGTGTDSAGNIYCGGNVNTDFSDIRFTDTDGTTLLNYWIESYTSSSNATVWINIPSIPTGSNSTYIYFYYSNPSATTTSNGTNTFLFFDDFNVDLSKWTASMSSLLSSSISNSIVTVTGTGSWVSNMSSLYSTTNVSKTNTSTRIRWNPGTWTYTMVGTYGYDTGAQGLWLSQAAPWIRSDQLICSGDGSTYTTTSTTVIANTWQIAELIRNGTTNLQYYLNGLLKTTKTDKIYSGDIRVGISPYTSGQSIQVDWVLVRNYSSPEPTWSSTIATGSLSISSAPPGAEIYLNGIDQGTTTTSLGTTISNLPPDTYNILLRLTGYADWTGTVTISSGTITSISVTISHIQWLTNWIRRKQLYISSSSFQLSYQMMTTVYFGSSTDTAGNIFCGNNVKSDFSDIRFTDSTGSTLLNHWIDPSTLITSISCNVWIQIPSILIGSNSVYIYIYYNNSSATTTSNEANTFTAADFTTFTKVDPNNRFTVNSSSKVTYTGLTANENAYLYKIIPSITDYRYDFEYLISGGSSSANHDGYVLIGGLADSANSLSNTSNSLYIRNYDAFHITTYRLYMDDNLSGVSSYIPPGDNYATPGLNTLYYITITRLGTTVTMNVYSNAARTSNISGSPRSGTVTPAISFGYALPITSINNAVTGSTVNGYIQNARLRKYASPEPTWSSTISTEQQLVIDITGIAFFIAGD